MKIRKIGYKWGKGADNMFFKLNKKNQVVVGYFDHIEDIPQLHDLILVAHGHRVLALVKVNSITNIKSDLLNMDFYDFGVGADDKTFVFRGEWYNLNQDEQFDYPLSQGNHAVHGEYVQKALDAYTHASLRQ